MMTKVGGEIEYVARTMTYDFKRPVRTGERITCEWTVEFHEERDDRYVYENQVVYHNEDDEVVVDAATTGLIWR